MSKKYLEDDDYDWDDDCEWDERYDEFDDSDDGEDEEEDERPARTKSSSSRSRRAVEETAVSSARVTVKSARTGAGSPASGKTGTKNSSSVRTGTKSSSSTKTGTKNGTSKKTGAGSSSTAGKGTSGKKVSARKKKRRRNMIVICILEVLLLAVICGGLFVMSKLDKIQKTPGGNVNFGPGGDAEYNELPSGVIASMENYTTYAVFGLDKRNMEQLDDGQSDVIIIASVNNQTGEINMVSVYRDTYLQID